MSPSRSPILLAAAMISCALLSPSRVQAQWWSRGPADFEECADLAEKATSREAKTSAMAACNAKFAGRRKPGGGYSYFDFMQNRNFDIAGPNPTPEEQRQIDEQYTAYLENQRRKTIAAAFLAKQQQMQQASLKVAPEKASLTTASIARPQTAPAESRRTKSATCAQRSFSCEWPRLSEGIKDLKKALFGSQPAKDKRG